MTSNNAIFIFTKDRPDVLEKTLISIRKFNTGIYIIDDSFQEINQLLTKQLISFFSDVSYIGKLEFTEFVRKHAIDPNNCKTILRQVGNNEWNLGYARNFALFYSKSFKFDNVLFLDDDINVTNAELVLNTFKLLEHYDFVGANITGLVDDSIIGHISNELGVIDYDERTLSGGFLAFKPQKIRLPFINVYNEDWIWLFLHSKENKYLQTDGVFQNYLNPYIGFKNKIMFQEIGEIIIIGILKLKKGNEYQLLTSKEFWIKILNERRTYLSELYHTASYQYKNEIIQMIKLILDKFSEIENPIFTSLFKNYLKDRRIFQKLYNSI